MPTSAATAISPSSTESTSTSSASPDESPIGPAEATSTTSTSEQFQPLFDTSDASLDTCLDMLEGEPADIAAVTTPYPDGSVPKEFLGTGSTDALGSNSLVCAMHTTNHFIGAWGYAYFDSDDDRDRFAAWLDQLPGTVEESSDGRRLVTHLDDDPNSAGNAYFSLGDHDVAFAWGDKAWSYYRDL